MGFNKLSGRQLLAIDDVSFTKEPCNQIPWKQSEGKVETRHLLIDGFPISDWRYSFITSGVRQVCLFVHFSFLLPGLLKRYFSKCIYSMKYI